MRKLQPWERLVGGMRTIAGQGIVPRIYATGVAAAVVMAIEWGETDMSFGEVLTGHCELAPGGELMELCEERRGWLRREPGLIP
jgi:hypothetical protein